MCYNVVNFRGGIMEDKNLEWKIDVDGVKYFVGLSNYVYDYVNLILSDFDDRRFVEDLLEKKEGMKFLIRDMYYNSDKRFFDLYKDKLVSKLGLDRVARTRNSGSERFKYFSSLYGFLEAYRHNKDDYDNFEAICDDVIFSSNNIVFSDIRKRYIDVVVRNKNYKNLPELRRFFKDVVLKEDEKDLYNLMPFYKSMFKLVDKVCDGEFKDERFKVANEVIKRAIDKDDKGYRVDLLYDDILLFGDRFSYFNDKLMGIEDNQFIREEIFSRVKGLNDEMFSYLNIILDDNDDSFKICMDCVFDSDTYREMLNKLDVLDKASFEYSLSNHGKAYLIIRNLNGEQHKEKINGDVVGYNKGCVKPEKMIERMKDLYSKVDDSKSSDFISRIHDFSVNIGAFYDYFGDFKNKEIVEDMDDCNFDLEDNYDLDIKGKVRGLFKRFVGK